MTDPDPAIQGLRHWRRETDASGVVFLCLDRQGGGTNVLSREVMAELDALLRDLERSPPRALVLHSGKPGVFVAGADINEFPAVTSAADAGQLAREGQRILDRLESLPCPSVAVLEGSALGGGLELAMAATWRIAVPQDQPSLGLPEVQLGLHPGFGGTVRAVRLLGVRRGLELMLTGRPMSTADALAHGLVDRLTTAAGWRADAVALVTGPPPRRGPALADRVLSAGPVRGFVARSLVRQTRRKADPDHYPAPYAMIDLWAEHGARGRAAFEAEARSFGELAVTPTSRNLVRVFFLQDRMKKLAGRTATPASHVHVVGAGVMGGDIAAWCALQGLTVTLQDREMKYVEPALARARKLFARRVRRDDARSAAEARLSADIAGDGVARADVVIEAIFENLGAKQELLRTVEARARPDCVIATNTSSIPLEAIMTCLRDPARLIGLHFFNPVAKLPLVEVVRTAATAEAALAAGLAFTRQIGKLPLPCRSHPGFLVNRILAPYLAEAMTLAEEGVPLPDIDAAATGFGMPMGPVELADSVGLDVALHVARILSPLIGRPVAPEIERLVAAGHLGQKTGRGFYVYQDGRPVKPRGSRDGLDPEIQDRLVMALLNESAHCLHEGIVADADLVDAGVIFGTGFAPFRGGPLHYARERGVGEVTAILTRLAERHGPRFAPSAGWGKLGAL
jgi:3-hydroxyacyl-CoA dehydrogenase/enoyl-CoA hydratase/3-hydroxybutyryl-CoA epimerase